MSGISDFAKPWRERRTMNDLVQALVDLNEVFSEMGLDYVVMGGIAVRAYGIPRPTYDLDFTIAIARDRLPELFAVVESRGYSVSDEYQRGWIDQVGGMGVVKCALTADSRTIDIDIFLAESPFQHSLLARRRRESIEQIDTWLVSPEDLLLLKLIASRPKDWSDISDVLFTQGQLDLGYLRFWSPKLGVAEKLEDALRQFGG